MKSVLVKLAKPGAVWGEWGAWPGRQRPWVSETEPYQPNWDIKVKGKFLREILYLMKQFYRIIQRYKVYKVGAVLLYHSQKNYWHERKRLNWRKEKKAIKNRKSLCIMIIIRGSRWLGSNLDWASNILGQRAGRATGWAFLETEASFGCVCPIKIARTESAQAIHIGGDQESPDLSRFSCFSWRRRRGRGEDLNCSCKYPARSRPHSAALSLSVAAMQCNGLLADRNKAENWIQIAHPLWYLFW